MAEHQEPSAHLGIEGSFRHPRDPCRDGSNENTNRLRYQYPTKHPDPRASSSRDRDDIAARINNPTPPRAG